ncbi:ImmA/IrrE family metallo-endopeptidase [Thomasclavelia cocleata]|nr:ImmA/IrrE family metallo-endopeptidase [Thomasclavelia cocleata]PJN80539.1 ImmA/IrrE family metallo-endopeptidase [Thomasclavelia cocleata]
MLRCVVEVRRVKKMCPPLEEIKGLTANELLKKYGQYDSMPIDIKKILLDIKAVLVEDDLSFLENASHVQENIKKYGELCGLVLATKEDLNIFYKKYPIDLTNDLEVKSVRNRTRFTLAHELAHCVLHAEHLEKGYLEFRFENKKINKDFRKRNEYENLEYSANIYAGQLLVPEHKLKEVLNKLIMPSLKSLSELFAVSSNVMRARLDYLGLEYVVDV